jgi:hypothetical protein
MIGAFGAGLSVLGKKYRPKANFFLQWHSIFRLTVFYRPVYWTLYLAAKVAVHLHIWFAAAVAPTGR